MFRLTGVFRALRRVVCSVAQEDPMGKGKFFYAVRKGLKPGVYHTWDECKNQVDKFPSAVYKKFGSERDAWAFVRGVQLPPLPPVTPVTPVAEPKKVTPSVDPDYALLLPKRGPEPLEYIPLGKKRLHSAQDHQGEGHTKRVKPSQDSASKSSDGFTYMGDAVVVYTDGCCSFNGRKNARAGIGVYWGPNHPLNVSEPLGGRQTNQRAEIQAACRALEVAKEQQLKKVVLYTDSMFTINGVTKWVKSWKQKGWKLKEGGQVKNKEDFIKLDSLNSDLDVVWDAVENKLDTREWPHQSESPAAWNGSGAVSARQKHKTSSPDERRTGSRLIIFVIGGITFSEMRCAYESHRQ